jgi:PAS domain S-box-containing protein
MTVSTDQPDTAVDPQKNPLPATALQQQGEGNLLKRQRAIVAMGRRAIAPPDLPILMQDAADLLAKVLGTEYGLVAELLPEGRSPRLKLALRKTGGTEPNTPVCGTRPPGTAFSCRADGSWGSNSLAGYALQIARPVVVADLPREKRFADGFLRKHGIRSAIAVPLKLQDRSFGSLAACTAESRYFGDEDLLFVETIGHLVTAVIGKVQAERSLADERHLAAGVLKTVDALVLVLDDEGQIVRINPACERLTGFSLEEIKGRPVWSVFSIAQEVDMCRHLLKQVRESKSPVEYESCLLTKHSQQRRIAWTCDVVAGGDETLETIIATGIDVTQQRQAEEKADRAAQAAERARQMMARELQAVQADSAPSDETRPADGSQVAGESGRLTPPSGVERRKHPRRSFLYKQRIAAVVDGKLPNQQTFTDVQCRNISSSGFSFLSPTPPTSDTLVVALGIFPKVTYLVAQVAHVTQIEKHGPYRFFIGCHYVGRAVYQEADNQHEGG